MLASIAALLLASASPAAAETVPTQIAHDRRMTIDVEINDNGPHAFVVDTGAERTVIAADLAARLRLPASDPVQMHSVTGLSEVPTVRIDRLRLDRLMASEIHAPILDGGNLGAAGILGIDTLRDRRIVLDFRKRQMTIIPSGPRADRSHDENAEIVVRARSRFGRLVVTDAEANGMRISVVIDTGAELTLGNPALESRLARRDRNFAGTTVDVIAVSGGIVTARNGTLRRVRLGDMHLANLPVAISDAHIFRALGLSGKPALLLGMDVLSQFDRVSIDFAERKVRFLAPETSTRPTGQVQSASNDLPHDP